MRIIEYETIGADDLRNLDHEVMLAIKDGWQPFGSIGVAMAADLDLSWHGYVQPMVRYENRYALEDK